MRTTPPGPPIRGHIRQVGFRRVSHGLFRPWGDDDDLGAELRRDLEAWLLVLPEGAAFTHVTAAWLRGWQLPKLPEQVPVFVAVAQGDTRPRRPGLICSRLARTGTRLQVHGLPVEPAEEVLLRAARDLGTLDLVILVDSARRLGHVDTDAMESMLSGCRPGVRNLRRAWGLSCAKAESAGETLLRLFHIALEVPVEPQVVIHDEAGNVVGQVDLQVTGTDLLHEYDGAPHREKGQHRTDLRRERALSRAGYQRRGFTLDDLLNHPTGCMHEIDRDLGRPHDRRRIRAWRLLVGNSLYSEAGRARVMNRWQRQMGVTDWSLPAG